MGKLLKVPVIEAQRGPSCGLYALAAVARCLDPKKYKDLYATKGDDPNKKEASSLRWTAKNTPLTQQKEGGKESISKIGEVFSSSGMKDLAEKIGLKAAVLQPSGDWLPVIKGAIDANRYLLAPFGVGSDGHPQTDGNRPHWCVIYGYDTEYWFWDVAVTMHWSTQYKFRLKNFAESSRNLKHFDTSYVKTGNKSTPNPKGPPVQEQRFDSGLARPQVSIGFPLRFEAIQPGKELVPLQGATPMQFNADLPNELAGKLVSVWL